MKLQVRVTRVSQCAKGDYSHRLVTFAAFGNSSMEQYLAHAYLKDPMEVGTTFEIDTDQFEFRDQERELRDSNGELKLDEHGNIQYWKQTIMTLKSFTR